MENRPARGHRLVRRALRKCEPCRRGDHICCVVLQIPGISYDGGYADYIVAPAMAVAAVPDSLSGAEAGPLLCAGITTYNAIRNSGARPPDVVAILGMGGLGHLGVQFAAKMGYTTVAIARGADKEKFAHELGAHYYIDNAAQDVSAELQKLGGARAIIATVTEADAMSRGLRFGPQGKLVMVGVPGDPFKVPAILIMQKRAVAGWPGGTSIDSEDTMKFSSLFGVKAMIEKIRWTRLPKPSSG